jgi:hypothetical protein
VLAVATLISNQRTALTHAPPVWPPTAAARRWDGALDQPSRNAAERSCAVLLRLDHRYPVVDPATGRSVCLPLVHGGERLVGDHVGGVWFLVLCATRGLECQRVGTVKRLATVYRPAIPVHRSW